MHFFDILTLLVVVWMIVSGIRSGLVSQLLNIVGIIIGVFLAISYGNDVGLLLGINAEYAAIAGFIIVLIITVILSKLAAMLISKLLSSIKLGWVNKLLGAIFAVIKGVIVLGLFYSAIYAINEPLKWIEPEQFEASKSFNLVRKASKPLLDHWDNIKNSAFDNQ